MIPKLLFSLLTFCLATTFLISCGGNNKQDYAVKPNSLDVKGDLSDFYEVVDGIYKIEKGENKYSGYDVKIQLKRTNKPFDFDMKDLAIYTDALHIHLDCDLLEDNGTPVVIGSGVMGDGTNIQERLLGLKPGETGWAEFSFGSGYKPEEMSKVKTFSLRSHVQKATKLDSNSSSDKNNSQNLTPASTTDEEQQITSVDCDKCISNYEDFINSYIKIMKKYKANPNDASIVNEYSEAAQKAAEMGNKVPLCTDTKYAEKLLELQNKLAKATL